jgi:hypothetical protein
MRLRARRRRRGREAARDFEAKGEKHGAWRGSWFGASLRQVPTKFTFMIHPFATFGHAESPGTACGCSRCTTTSTTRARGPSSEKFGTFQTPRRETYFWKGAV